MHDSSLDKRHAFRAKWHDYGCGIYFITICCHQKAHIMGKITDGEMTYSELGQIADDCIKAIPTHHPDVELWNHVVMPNHIHIVLALHATPPATTSTTIGCLKPPRHGEECSDYHHNSKLAIIVGTFKAAVTRQARTQCIKALPATIWQRLYHEHIIRSQYAYENIMTYIDENVMRWDTDCFNK